MVVLGLVAGGVTGVAVARSGSNEGATEVDGSLVDVVHNPPLLVGKGEVADLTFRTVCSGVVCPSSTGTLTVTEDSGAVHTETQAAGRDEPLVFAVDPAWYADGPATYSATFTAGSDGLTMTWPDVASAPAAIQGFVPSRVIDLGTADFAADEATGVIAFQASWGSGPSQLGVDGSVGPSSFDVEPDGTIDVLDLVNSRLVRADPAGTVEPVKLDLRRDFPDIAVEGDGTLDVLYPDGAGTGQSFVDRFSQQGTLLESVPLVGRRSYNIRHEAGTVTVGADQRVTEVIVGGKALGRDQQIGLSTSALGRTGSAVVSKHVSDHVVRLVEVDGRTGRATAASWEVVSDTPLGPIALAEPVAGGVLLVQSQFTDERSRFLALYLRRNGPIRITPLPDRRFIEVTAGSEFRLVGHTLYAARSDAEHFQIASYVLTKLGIEK
jgi:hypothetical protein